MNPKVFIHPSAFILPPSEEDHGLNAATTDQPATPLAIIGIGCLFPGADSLRAYWANICHGVDSIRDVPPSHWHAADYLDVNPGAPDKVYAARGGFLDSVTF